MRLFFFSLPLICCLVLLSIAKTILSEEERRNSRKRKEGFFVPDYEYEFSFDPEFDTIAPSTIHGKKVGWDQVSCYSPSEKDAERYLYRRQKKLHETSHAKQELGPMYIPSASPYEKMERRECAKCEWKDNGFGSCVPDNGICGKGTQQNSYTLSNTDNVDVKDCLPSAQQPETKTEACETRSCRPCSWIPTGYTACEGSCGQGVRYKTYGAPSNPDNQPCPPKPSDPPESCDTGRPCEAPCELSPGTYTQCPLCANEGNTEKQSRVWQVTKQRTGNKPEHACDNVLQSIKQPGTTVVNNGNGTYREDRTCSGIPVCGSETGDEQCIPHPTKSECEYPGILPGIIQKKYYTTLGPSDWRDTNPYESCEFSTCELPKIVKNITVYNRTNHGRGGVKMLTIRFTVPGKTITGSNSYAYDLEISKQLYAVEPYDEQEPAHYTDISSGWKFIRKSGGYNIPLATLSIEDEHPFKLIFDNSKAYHFNLGPEFAKNPNAKKIFIIENAAGQLNIALDGGVPIPPTKITNSW